MDGPLPSGEEILCGELLQGRPGLGIATKRFSQDGNKSPREIPKQAMGAKDQII